MKMEKSRLRLPVMWMTAMLVWLGGCDGIDNKTDASMPLCVSSQSASLRAPTFLGENANSTDWMLTDLRHVDAYRQYQRFFDGASALSHAAAPETAFAGARRTGSAAAFSCLRR